MPTTFLRSFNNFPLTEPAMSTSLLLSSIASGSSPSTSYSAPSARVKSLDVHPTQPWVLTGLYDGHVVIHDLHTKTVLKTIRVSDLPVRAARFVVRMNWIVAAGDDQKIHVVDLASGSEITAFTAHEDYVRALLVHDTKPLVFSCGDDMRVKAWDWTRSWMSVHELRGHEHYVMAIASADANILASVGLDHSVKMWQFSSTGVDVDATLIGHTSGVNAIAVDHTTRQLLTGGDDRTLRAWDLETRTEAAVAPGHTHNITSVLSHATLPLVFTGSEDESVRVWARGTLAPAVTWAPGLGRVWSLAAADEGRALAVGCDRGLVVLPVAAIVPASRM